MYLSRGVFRASAFLLALTMGVIAIRYIARAAETGPAIHVDSTPIDRDPKSGNSYALEVKKVAPSVVNIYSSRIVKQRLYRNPFMADPLLRELLGDQGYGGSREVTHRDNWLGCGIIVAPDGYILTASHVVEGADEIKVNIQNDRTYSAKVVGTDPPTDVAILKIEANNLPAVTLGDSDQLEVGDVVLAIGNPFGIGQTVTRGIISALGRSLSDPNDEDSSDVRQYQNFIQTDAAINEGNSGGALVDAAGRLIGINDAIVSPSGASAGIGFAVPINMARSVMEGFLKNGRVTRGYLGVEPEDMNADLAREYGTPTTEGTLITYVAPNSPAAKGGMQADDVVVGINDKAVSGADDFMVTISELAPGSQAKVKVYRNGAPKTITVVLAERQDAVADSVKPDTNTVQPAKADALDGVEVTDLDARLRRELDAEDDVQGALITDVDRASNSYEAGLRPGDVIMEINRQATPNADDAVRVCKAARSEEIMLKIWRPSRTGGRILVLNVDNTKRRG